jgi:CTD small phosphatase-like protein 2
MVPQRIRSQEANNLKVRSKYNLAAKMSRFSNLVNTKKIDGDVEIEPEFSDNEKKQISVQ